jgi:ribosomal protein L23
VLKVHTMVMPPKRGRRYRQYYVRKSAWKKAIVTLPPGQTIGLFHV